MIQYFTINNTLIATCVFVCVCVCVCVCVYVYVCVCICVCVCVHVCVSAFTVKVSSVWISWDTREQINDVILKKLISSAKSLHRYFRMQHITCLTSHFILFPHQKRAKPRINQCTSRFQNMGPSFNIKQASPSVRTTS